MADDNPSQKEIDRHRDAFEVTDNSYLATQADLPEHLDPWPAARCPSWVERASRRNILWQ